MRSIRAAGNLGEPGLATLLRPREVEDGDEEEGIAVSGKRMRQHSALVKMV